MTTSSPLSEQVASELATLRVREQHGDKLIYKQKSKQVSHTFICMYTYTYTYTCSKKQKIFSVIPRYLANLFNQLNYTILISDFSTRILKMPLSSTSSTKKSVNIPCQSLWLICSVRWSLSLILSLQMQLSLILVAVLTELNLHLCWNRTGSLCWNHQAVCSYWFLW